jgi:hypothetical protein
LIVQTIQTAAATVHIADDALQALSPAQVRANRIHAGRVAAQIAARAMERGAVEGLTPEEWRRRYGRDPYADG